ncbi:MAG: hypothetical protein U0169_13170 [Polyangiaceae bacterium]
MRVLAGTLAFGVLAVAEALFPTRAFAAESERAPTATAPAAEGSSSSVVERRGGLLLALQAGGGVASTVGYPLAITKVGDPAYLSRSGTMIGSASSLLVMAALADYLNFGIHVSSGRFQNQDVQVTSFGMGVRVDAFPLYGLAARKRALRDLGVYASFGLGGSKLEAKSVVSPGAEGVQSFLGVGAFYEWSFGHLFGGHFAGGPSIGYETIFSQSIEQHAVAVAGRIAYYGSP